MGKRDMQEFINLKDKLQGAFKKIMSLETRSKTRKALLSEKERLQDLVGAGPE